MEYIQNNETEEDELVKLILEKKRAAVAQEIGRPSTSKPEVSISSRTDAKNTYDTFDIPLDKPVKKKLSGAQRKKKKILNALSKGLPILTPGEIRKNLNAYGRHSPVDFEEVRLQKMETMSFKRTSTSSKENPYKWVSPAYKAAKSSLTPEATVTSQTSQSRSEKQYPTSSTVHNPEKWPGGNFNPTGLRKPLTPAQKRRMLRHHEAPHTATFDAATGEESEKIKKMGIAHSNHPSITLSDYQCQIIQNDLVYEFLKCQSGRGPQFKNIFVNNNVVWLTTANEYSRNWLYENIPHFEPWPGARLKAGLPFEIKGLVRVAAYLPKSMNDIESDKIFQMLKFQNRGLNTEKWTVIRTISELSGRTLILQIDYESLKRRESCSRFQVINIPGQGKISGVEKSKLRVQKIVAYYGIPYAQPPVDTLRFTPPVIDPLPSWSDVMRNTEYPPSCFQSEADYKNSEKPFLQLISNLSFALQEDCLYLNVFAPMVDDPKGLPTVIWFHPGDFATGSPIMWDPHTVVYRQNLIVVTVAYRLNIFGFFTTMDGEATGNYGLMDQQAAMQWVKRNIEHFGGNANNICIMGYGAGATSIAIHLINPASKGLFNKAIALSGKYFSANVVKLPEESKSLLDELSSNFGCDRKPTSRLINCLRGIEPDILIKPTFDFNWGPTIDVDITNTTPFLTDYPIRYFERGDFEKVPLMTGYTSMEHIMDIEGLKNITSVSTEDLRSLLADLLSDEISAVNYTESACAHNYDHLVDAVMFFYLPMTPVDDPDKFRTVITNFLTEKYYAASSYLLASFMSKYNSTYIYRSDIRPSTDNATIHLPKWVTVPHLFDLIYIWGVPYWSNGQEWHKRDKSISEIIMTLWTNFVKNSNPTQYPVEWSNFTEQNPGILINVNGTFKMSDSRDVNYKAFEFWNQYFPKVKAIVSQCCEALENTSSVVSYNVLFTLYPLLVTSIWNYFF